MMPRMGSLVWIDLQNVGFICNYPRRVVASFLVGLLGVCVFYFLLFLLLVFLGGSMSTRCVFGMYCCSELPACSTGTRSAVLLSPIAGNWLLGLCRDSCAAGQW